LAAGQALDRSRPVERLRLAARNVAKKRTPISRNVLGPRYLDETPLPVIARPEQSSIFHIG